MTPREIKFKKTPRSNMDRTIIPTGGVRLCPWSDGVHLQPISHVGHTVNMNLAVPYEQIDELVGALQAIQAEHKRQQQAIVSPARCETQTV